MQGINENTLKSYMTENPSSRLFYIVGNDEFLMSVCRRIIAAEKRCVETERFDAEKPNEQLLSDEFFNLPLIADNKLIVIDNFMPSKLSEHSSAFFAGLFANIPSHITVAVSALYDTDFFSVPKQCLSLLGDSAAVVEVCKKSGDELTRIVAAFAKRSGAQMTAGGAQRLIWLCGNDLELLKNEVDKAAALCGYGEITEDVVSAVVPRTVESNVYEMIRAVSAGKKALAVEKLEELYSQKSEPMMIAATLTNSFVNIYRAKCAREAGASVNDFYKAFGYKTADKKPKIAYDQSSGYSRGSLEAIIGILYALQTALRQSPAEPERMLETALFEIMTVKG